MPAKTRNIKGFVPKYESSVLPTINANIIGATIQPETWLNISTADFQSVFPFSFGIKNKAVTALTYNNIKKVGMQIHT